MGAMNKVLESIDEITMKGATRMVNAWNWTTGRTKTDLANLLSTCSAASICAGTAYEFPALLPAAFPYVYVMWRNQKRNREIETKEIDSYLDGIKNMEVEKYKGQLRIAVPVYVPLVSLIGSHGMATSDYTEIGVAAAFSLDMMGCNIMRVDNPPPRRKNCISRGLDKLDEIVAKVLPNSSTALEPALARNPVL